MKRRGKIPVELRPKRLRGTVASEVPPSSPSFEEAVVAFIMAEEKNGEGLWLEHIQSQAFTHKEKPTGSGSQEKLLQMLRSLSSLAESVDDETDSVVFKVKATADDESLFAPTAVDLIHTSCYYLDCALQCHAAIKTTPRGNNVVVSIDDWKQLKWYMMEARSYLCSD